MKYLVYINARPDDKITSPITVEGVYISVNDGTLIIAKEHEDHSSPQPLACFAPGTWNMVIPG